MEVGKLAARAFAVTLLVGCVNNYVVERGQTGSSESGAPGSSGTLGPTSGGSSGSSTRSTGEADTGPMTGDPTPVPCQPCTGDTECGGAFDRCVDVLESGPVCMFACPEPQCATGYACSMEVSVDGVNQAVCVPDACEPA